jgi:hypothetical protein
MDCDILSLFSSRILKKNRIFLRLKYISYETNKRKIQEKFQIFACKLPSSKRTRAIIARSICAADADLHLVGHHRTIIPIKITDWNS